MAQSAALAENLVRAFITASEPCSQLWKKDAGQTIVVPVAANTSIFRTTSK